MSFKRCSTCGGFMNRRYFHRDKTRRDGLACRCKGCESERQKLLYRKRRYGEFLRVRGGVAAPARVPALAPTLSPGAIPDFDE